MAKRDEGSNIFDLAGSQKRKVPPKKPTPAPAKPTEQAPKPPEQDQPTEKIDPQDAVKMIEKMNKLHEELQAKLESTYEKSGITKHDVRTVVKILSEEDKVRLQRDKQALEEKVWGALGENAREQKLRKDQERLERIRKAKGIGGRQKWIKTK